MTPLDYASEHDSALIEYLRVQGGLTGAEKIPQAAPLELTEVEEEGLVESAPVEASIVEDSAAKLQVTEEPDAGSEEQVHMRVRRASSPSKQSLDDVVFEPEMPAAVERATTPDKLKRLVRQDAKLNLGIPAYLNLPQVRG